MEDKIEHPDLPEPPAEGSINVTVHAVKPRGATKVSKGSPPIAPSPGLWHSLFGSGDFAKEGFIGVVIVASFVCGFLGSVVIASKEECGGNFVSEVKNLWTIFVPLITLALGYAFGKWK